MQNKLNTLQVPIKGMHCTSCELLIEKSLKKIHGVHRVEVSHVVGQATIYYQKQQPDNEKIESAIRSAGYTIGSSATLGWLSQNAKDYKDIGLALLLALGGWWLLQGLGLTKIGLGAGANPKSLSVAILVGLVAGFSTCMALVGGLTLGLSAKYSEHHPGASAGAKFRPHLFFNLGRLIGFGLLGGLLGSLGSVFQFSSLTMGLLTLAVAGVMLLLGLQLTELSPRLTRWKLTLPKSIAGSLGLNKEKSGYSHRGAGILGALTFFLPCGFTQAMQLYAVSTGSFARGAMVMALFALGTAPGLLSVGGITSVAGGKKGKFFFKFAGVVVIFLALFNAANAITLTKMSLNLGDGSGLKNSTVKIDPNVTLENGVQIVRMTEKNYGYSPNSFTIRAGIPVRWIIEAQAPYSCASQLVMPKLNIRKNLVAGENIIEFTPTKAGQIPFSCSMGMYTGVFNVIDGADTGNNPGTGQTDNSNLGTNSAFAAAAPSAAGSCGASGGCGCGGGARQAPTSAPSAPVAAEQTGDNLQIIRTSYTSANYLQPSAFKIKVGIPVKLEIAVKDSGYGCGSAITIPGLYNGAVSLVASQPIIMEFTPTATGSFDITCGMGMIRFGSITVE